MKPSFSKRWLLWVPMLATAAALPFMDHNSNVSQPVASAVEPGAPRERHIAKGDDGQSSLLHPISREVLLPLRSSRHRYRDLFASQSWNPPPSPVKPDALAPQSEAPAPFTFLGKKLEAGTWEVYLGNNDQSLIVREGTAIDGLYRVEKIDPPNLTLTYLPSGAMQTISIGEGE